MDKLYYVCYEGNPYDLTGESTFVCYESITQAQNRINQLINQDTQMMRNAYGILMCECVNLVEGRKNYLESKYNIKEFVESKK